MNTLNLPKDHEIMVKITAENALGAGPELTSRTFLLIPGLPSKMNPPTAEYII
jgi:hypothetical protein